MGFLRDLAQSLYDWKGMGQELARRSTGRIVMSLVTLGILYGIVTGQWYATAFGELAKVAAREASRRLPAVVLSNGTLSSPVPQPYIVTAEQLSPELFEETDAWFARWLHIAQPGVASAFVTNLLRQGTNPFCLILDTTNAYQQQINPDDYAIAVVVTDQTITVSSQREGGIRQARQVPLSQVTANAPLGVPLALDPAKIDADQVAKQVRGRVWLWFVLASSLVSVLRFALKALLVGLLAWIVAQATKKAVSFGQAYAVAVYALVPVVVLAFVRLMIWPYPGFLLLLVHVVYGVVPVLYAPARQPVAQLAGSGRASAS